MRKQTYYHLRNFLEIAIKEEKQEHNNKETDLSKQMLELLTEIE